MTAHYTTFRWTSTALTLAASMLMLPQASAQTQGAGAMFEGRPAMAGAQGGQGAQAGPPQGGLGVQGSEGEKGLNLRKPSGLDAMPPLPRDPGLNPAGVSPDDITPKKEAGIAREQRSAASKVKRAARRTAERSNNRPSGIESLKN